jgi:hypothetical protein
MPTRIAATATRVSPCNDIVQFAARRSQIHLCAVLDSLSIRSLPFEHSLDIVQQFRGSMSTTKKPRSSSAPRKSAVNGETKNTSKTAAPKSRAAKTNVADRKVAAVPREPELAGTPAPSTRDIAPAPAVSTAAPQADTPLQGGQSTDALHRMIAEAAYYRAERRGFAPGGEEIDWLEAEAEVRGAARLR